MIRRIHPLRRLKYVYIACLLEAVTTVSNWFVLYSPILGTVAREGETDPKLVTVRTSAELEAALCDR